MATVEEWAKEKQAEPEAEAKQADEMGVGVEKKAEAK